MRSDVALVQRTAVRASEMVMARIVVPPRNRPPIEKQMLVLKAALEKLYRFLPKPRPKRRPVRRAAPLLVACPVPTRPFDDLELPRDPGQLGQEISGCKMLLLEIIRRAAYDWVLYRSSRKMVNRVLAEQAFTWIFVEGPPHADWRERESEGKSLTSFESICMHLDLQSEVVRAYIRKLEPRNVMSIGRPAEYRRGDGPSQEALNISIKAHLLDAAFAEASSFEETGG